MKQRATVKIMMSLAAVAMFVLTPSVCAATAQKPPAKKTSLSETELRTLAKTVPDVKNAGQLYSVALATSNDVARQQEYLKAAAAGLIACGKADIYNKHVKGKLQNAAEFEDELKDDCKQCSGVGAKERRCSACRGKGQCPTCKGTGQTMTTVSFSFGKQSKPCSKCNESGQCPKCGGEGSTKEKCLTCGGTGKTFSKTIATRVFRDSCNAIADGMNVTMASNHANVNPRERRTKPKSVAKGTSSAEKIKPVKNDKADTKYELGMRYLKGEGVAKEIYAKGYVSYELKGRFTDKYDEAFKLFTEASRLGFLPADAMLSYMYCVGEGCKTDHAKAFVHAKKVVSCEECDVSNGDYHDASNLARFTLGTLYLVGFTDANGKRQKDDYKAYDYYCEMVRSMGKSERQGKPPKSYRTLLDRTGILATFAIALMQYEGRGTSKSIDAAAKLFELFTRLDDNGDSIEKMRGEAAMCLGLLCYRGDGVGRNRALAWKHLRNGAALAFPELIRAAKAPPTNDDIANFNRYFGHAEISLWTPYSWKMYNLYKGKGRPHMFSLIGSDLLDQALRTLFNPDCWVASGIEYNFDDM